MTAPVHEIVNFISLQTQHKGYRGNKTQFRARLDSECSVILPKNEKEIRTAKTSFA